MYHWNHWQMIDGMMVFGCSHCACVDSLQVLPLKKMLIRSTSYSVLPIGVNMNGV